MCFDAYIYMYDCVSCYRFGGRPDDYPHPEAESKAFLKAIHVKNQQHGTIYSPMKKCLRPWIEESSLQSQYYGSCTIM